MKLPSFLNAFVNQARHVGTKTAQARIPASANLTTSPAFAGMANQSRNAGRGNFMRMASQPFRQSTPMSNFGQPSFLHQPFSTASQGWPHTNPQPGMRTPAFRQPVEPPPPYTYAAAQPAAYGMPRRAHTDPGAHPDGRPRMSAQAGPETHPFASVDGTGDEPAPYTKPRRSQTDYEAHISLQPDFSAQARPVTDPFASVERTGSEPAPYTKPRRSQADYEAHISRSQ